MSPDENAFFDLLEGYRKFGNYPNECAPTDLPALTEYCKNLRGAASGSLMDAGNLLSVMEPDIRDCVDFGSAVMVAYSVVNAMQRVLTLADIGGSVSLKIEEMECGHTPPERVEVHIQDSSESVKVIRETAAELRGALVGLDTFLAERT